MNKFLLISASALVLSAAVQASSINPTHTSHTPVPKSADSFKIAASYFLPDYKGSSYDFKQDKAPCSSYRSDCQASTACASNAHLYSVDDGCGGQCLVCLSCADVTCDTNTEKCVNGQCAAVTCSDKPSLCTDKQKCVNGDCVAKTCADIPCVSNEKCLESTLSCITKTCPEDFPCESGKTCKNGVCLNDTCPGSKVSNCDTTNNIASACETIASGKNCCACRSKTCTDDASICDSSQKCANGTCVTKTCADYNAGYTAEMQSGQVCTQVASASVGGLTCYQDCRIERPVDSCLDYAPCNGTCLVNPAKVTEDNTTIVVTQRNFNFSDVTFAANIKNINIRSYPDIAECAKSGIPSITGNLAPQNPFTGNDFENIYIDNLEINNLSIADALSLEINNTKIYNLSVDGISRPKINIIEGNTDLGTFKFENSGIAEVKFPDNHAALFNFYEIDAHFTELSLETDNGGSAFRAERINLDRGFISFYKLTSYISILESSGDESGYSDLTTWNTMDIGQLIVSNGRLDVEVYGEDTQISNLDTAPLTELNITLENYSDTPPSLEIAPLYFGGPRVVIVEGNITLINRDYDNGDTSTLCNFEFMDGYIGNFSSNTGFGNIGNAPAFVCNNSNGCYTSCEGENNGTEDNNNACPQPYEFCWENWVAYKEVTRARLKDELHDECARIFDYDYGDGWEVPSDQVFRQIYSKNYGTYPFSSSNSDSYIVSQSYSLSPVNCSRTSGCAFKTIWDNEDYTSYYTICVKKVK